MRIVDLFSGAGGLTFGFYYSLSNGQFVRNYDNEIIFANECDPHAANSFRTNFPDVPLIEKKIENLTEKEIRQQIGGEKVDLIVGGPPCQSFSTIGRRNYDERAKLYEQYLKVLQIVQPSMFVFENVKGILSMKDDKEHSVMQSIRGKFAHINNKLGYVLFDETLNAVRYGVPQNRERVFLVGVRNDKDISWRFPYGNDSRITLMQAISDLPTVKAGQTAVDYITDPQNPYQRLMRGNRPLTHHAAAIHGKKIQTVIENVKQGEGHDDFNRKVNAGEIGRQYLLTSGYRNTYGRLMANQPCTTITHNMSTPSGLRCIHYEQHRALTPREGARIQSFPDDFQFHGPRTHIKTQIGNAVPPLLALALARSIEEALI
jgi:DNA (cytosine-5)-methyltransferase 1